MDTSSLTPTVHDRLGADIEKIISTILKVLTASSPLKVPLLVMTLENILAILVFHLSGENLEKASHMVSDPCCSISTFSPWEHRHELCIMSGVSRLVASVPQTLPR